jgi:cytoskeletal protein RodZ
MQKKDYTNLFRLSPKDKEEVEERGDSAGAILKQARLAQGLTLEQVAAATNIPSRSLRALEESDGDGMPARAFVRGFIAIYARHLRLAPQELLARHTKHTGDRDAGGAKIDAHAIVKLYAAARKVSLSPYPMIAALMSAATLLALLYWGYVSYFL